MKGYENFKTGELDEDDSTRLGGRQLKAVAGLVVMALVALGYFLLR